MAASVWKGHITFGLVSIPVKLAVAARGDSLSFNQLHKKDHSRVKQVLFCQSEDTPVERKDLVKGYEYEKDKYVVIDENDLESVQPKTAKVMEITQFVDAAEIDGVYLESSFYVQPDDAGEKPYTLLYAAMKDSHRAAVAQLSMHNREHIVCLRPGPRGLILHTLFYKEEIRETSEFRADVTTLNQPEMKMAQTLIEAMTGKFEPDQYKDTYRERIQAMIAEKVKGHKVVEAPQSETAAPVIDIMEALKRSLSGLKKPAASDQVAAPKKRRAG